MRTYILRHGIYLVLVALLVLILVGIRVAAAAPAQQSGSGNLGGVVCETVLVGNISSTSVTWYPNLTYEQALAQGVVNPNALVYVFPNGTWYVGSLVSTLCVQTGVCSTPPPLPTPTVLPPTPCPPGSPGCGGSTPPPPTLRDGPPRCVGIIVRNIGMDCVPNCTQTYASGDIPCMNALRDPYPRGLVTVSNAFTLNGPFSSNGAPVSCPDAAIPNPRYRNRRLQALWRMDSTEAPPLWRFDERPWNIANGAANTALGFTVQHTYETSSFGKPANGPSLNGGSLEAYQVDVVTHWRASVVREWDQWGWVGGTYQFIRHVRVVDPINLAQWGHPTSFMESTRAQDPRAPTNMCNIPTPIIEAQSILVP